jgi:hypothetical protein
MNAHLWGDLADDEAAAALLSHAMPTIGALYLLRWAQGRTPRVV